MANPYLGEIRMFAGNFAPFGWALCNGQLLSIASNTALFSLIGTYYGGDGQTTFALPNLQSRVAIHQGQGLGLSPYVIGQAGGTENVMLTAGQMPTHNHAVNVDSSNQNTTGSSPSGGYLGNPGGGSPIYSSSSGATLNASAVGTAGGGQPHQNIQPYLTINFIIALQGIYPSRS